jgi:hypothetical protein
VEFNSHIFIELKNMTVQDLEQTRITIRLMEKSYFKNAMIGCFEFDFTHIYFMERHTWEHAWLGLTNPETEDYSQVNAYIKLSGSIYGADDNPVELNEDTQENDENCVMPATVKPTFKQLKLHIFKGEHLPRLDVAEGKMDAYVDTKIGKRRIKTKTVTTKKDEAEWNETLLIPVRMPVMTGKLILNVKDEDDTGDEQAGALIFDFKALLEMSKNGRSKVIWTNIYGAPGQEEINLFSGNSAMAKVMNNDPVRATKWKGRILIGIESADTDKPEFRV